MKIIKFVKKYATLSVIALSVSSYAGTISTDGSTSMENVIGMLLSTICVITL